MTMGLAFLVLFPRRYKKHGVLAGVGSISINEDEDDSGAEVLSSLAVRVD